MRYAEVTIEGGPTTHNVKITDAKGDSVKGVAAADIAMRANQPVRVTLQIDFAKVKLSGQATFMAAHPRSGVMKAVAKIEFADGTVFDPSAD